MHETGPEGPVPAVLIEVLVDLEVSATREHQSGDRTKCENDSTHELHLGSPSLGPPGGEALLQWVSVGTHGASIG
jgi:hypothetical protein